jgi:hypothetical protein
MMRPRPTFAKVRSLLQCVDDVETRKKARPHAFIASPRLPPPPTPAGQHGETSVAAGHQAPFPAAAAPQPQPPPGWRPALATARRTRCTGRPTLLHHHRRHLRPAPLHHHRRCLHQSLLRLPLGARLMIRGLAWSRPGPCPRRLHLHLVLLRPTLAPRHPACALILALLDSSARALRRTLTMPLRSTMHTSPMEGASTCNISPLPAHGTNTDCTASIIDLDFCTITKLGPVCVFAGHEQLCCPRELRYGLDFRFWCF